MRREETELERPGELFSPALRIVLGVCAFGTFVSLLVLLNAIQATPPWSLWPAMLSAAFFVGVAIVSILWSAFWTKLKAIAQDLYVIRQILEHRKFAGSGANAEDEGRVG